VYQPFVWCQQYRDTSVDLPDGEGNKHSDVVLENSRVLYGDNSTCVVQLLKLHCAMARAGEQNLVIRCR